MNMRSPIIVVSALALASCATGGVNPRADLSVTMTGIQEVPGPGDPDGTGTAEINVDPANSRVCWNLYARQIDQATAAHIHRGAEGVAGPPVVTLTTPGSDGHSQGCATVDEMLARSMAIEAHGYYANVHTAAFPNGAIRGQLRGGPNSRAARQPGY
jgi:hypothetical protein